MIRYPAMILAAALAGFSGYLTFEFTCSLGEALGFPLVMGFIGVCLEGAKALFPSAAVKAHREGNHALALSLAAVVVLIMAVSFAASMSTLTKGVDSAVAGNADYVSLTNQIELLEKSAAADIESVKYRGRGKQTLEQVSQLREQRAALPSKSIVGEHGWLISLVISGLVEVVGCLLVVVSMSGANVREQNEQEQSKPEQNKPSKPKTASPVLTVVEQVEPEQKQLVFQAKEDVCEQIRTALLTRSIERPSVNCVRQTFNGVASSKISAILKELGEAGHLVPRGQRGWVYA